MPRPASVLPTAEYLYERLDHPPWHAVSSAELAALLGVHLNSVWNWTMRGTGPEPEPGGIHVRASNRRFFLLCNVLAWLSAREGAATPAGAWVKRWLAECRVYDPDRDDPDSAEILGMVSQLERLGIRPHRWKVRRSAYDARLREVIGVPLGPAAGPGHKRQVQVRAVP